MAGNENETMSGAPELQATYSDASDVQHVAEELAVHSVISEERHEEILEEQNQCLLRLDQLSTELKTENSQLRADLIQEVTAIAEVLRNLKEEMRSLKESRAIPPSLPLNGPIPEPEAQPQSDADGRPEPKIEEQPPAPPHPPEPKKRRRI
jgi:hypothetical protein